MKGAGRSKNGGTRTQVDSRLGPPYLERRVSLGGARGNRQTLHPKLQVTQRALKQRAQRGVTSISVDFFIIAFAVLLCFKLIFFSINSEH